MPAADSASRASVGVRRRPGLILLGVILGLLASLTGAGSAPAQDGVILGTIYGADHPDSVAPGAGVILVFRDGTGAVSHKSSGADPLGRFRFSGLAADSSISYVLKVDYRELSFLSAPVHFRAGESKLEYDVLVTPESQPSGLGGSGELPPGHVPVVGGDLQAARPVRARPGLTLALVGAVALLFALPVLLLRRNDLAAGRPRPAPVEGKGGVPSEGGGSEL